MGAGGVGSTNNVAELYAVEAAILIASRIKSYMVSQGMEIQQIIVKTDSSYVSETLSRHVWRWWWDPRAQVYLNARGQPRKNSHLIHGIKRWLYDDPNQNFRVKFWRVRREQNADADRLANIALNEYSEPEYDSRDLFEHNFPWESWKYQFEYQPRDMATALAADEVIQRLEFPLETHNEWSRSVAFFLIQQAEGARYWPKNDQPIVHCQIRDLIFKGATTDIQEICMRYFGSRASVELENATSRQDDFNNYVVKIPLGICKPSSCRSICAVMLTMPVLEHLLKSDLADLQARKVRI